MGVFHNQKSTLLYYCQYNINNMGNQTKTVSKFDNSHQWQSIAKTNSKEIIQNKLTRQVVEKHRLQQTQYDFIRYDNLIYEWRKDPKTAIYVIQILQHNQSFQEQNNSCIGICHNSNMQTDILVYTENLLKLYEMNSRIQLEEGDQIGILKDIIEGIDILSQKFGQFIPSKDSVGYNSKKRGKVWINDNFCSNSLQQKRIVKSKEERLLWQSQIIQAIVDICELCTTRNNYKNNKFYYLLEIIKKNKLDQFSKVRDFKGPKRQLIQQKKEPIKISAQILKNANKKVQIADSQNIVSSNQFITTQDPRQKQAVHEEYRMVNKTFVFPMIPITQQKQISNIHYQTVYNYQNSQKIKFTSKEVKAGVNQNLRRAQELKSYARPNQGQIKKNRFNSYPRQDYFDQKLIYPKNQLSSRLRQPKQKPAHYALLQQMYDSRSSRSQSKMVKKQTIVLVDSMEMVENRHQYHQYDHHHAFNKLRNTILQESIILKAPCK